MGRWLTRIDRHSFNAYLFLSTWEAEWWFTSQLSSRARIGPNRTQKPRTPTGVAGSLTFEPISGPSWDALAGSWIKCLRIRIWTCLHKGCRHLKWWFNLLYHKACCSMLLMSPNHWRQVKTNRLNETKSMTNDGSSVIVA